MRRGEGNLQIGTIDAPKCRYLLHLGRMTDETLIDM
jgi:hypothetical protein